MERMSRKHVPNRFPAALRAMLLVFSVLALFYAVAELAIGYTYLPGKRGGMLLSGVPTLCIAAGSLLLCLSALLVVVDHYDTRDNEERYKRLRAQALKTGAVLIVIAPLIEIALIFVRVGSGAEPLSPAGFAADVTWHDGTMKPYAGKVAAITDSGFFMGTLGVTFVIAVVAMIAEKRKIESMRRFNALAILGFCAMLAMVLILTTCEQFLGGEVRMHGSGTIYTAREHPAVFNAVLLTKGMAGLALLLVCPLAAVGVLRQKAAGS